MSPSRTTPTTPNSSMSGRRSASQAWPSAGRVSINVRAVVDRFFTIRLAGHQHESRSGLGVVDGQSTSSTKERDLGSAGAHAVGADARLSLEHPYECVEFRSYRRTERAALRQLDVENQPGRPELHGRPRTDQRADDRVAVIRGW